MASRITKGTQTLQKLHGDDADGEMPQDYERSRRNWRSSVLRRNGNYIRNDPCGKCVGDYPSCQTFHNAVNLV